jgi:hypothetical protein
MIPTKISQTVLDRLAAPGEVLAVVVSTAGSGLGTFVMQGRSNRTFAFQFAKTRGAHVLRFPASFWTAKKGEIARELFDHTNPQPLVPTVEPWDASRSLGELIMPPAAIVDPEPLLSQPNSDLAPTGPGLAIDIPPSAQELADARRFGREDFGLDSTKGNPFDPVQFAAFHQEWQAGFDEAAAEHDKETAESNIPFPASIDGPGDPDTDPAVHSDEGSSDDTTSSSGDGTTQSHEGSGGFSGSSDSHSEESHSNSPPSPAFRLDGTDILLGDERVGGLFEPGNHLRMAKGKTDIRDQVEAFLSTLP